MKFLVIFSLLLLAGCATVGTTNMTSDQLKAVAGDNDLAAVCSTVAGPWGTGKMVLVTQKKAPANGTITATADCTITSINEATVKPIPIVTPAVTK